VRRWIQSMRPDVAVPCVGSSCEGRSYNLLSCIERLGFVERFSLKFSFASHPLVSARRRALQRFDRQSATRLRWMPIGHRPGGEPADRRGARRHAERREPPAASRRPGAPAPAPAPRTTPREADGQSPCNRRRPGFRIREMGIPKANSRQTHPVISHSKTAFSNGTRVAVPAGKKGVRTCRFFVI